MQKMELSGTVLDEITKQPLPYATISIFKAADSSLVDGGITNEEGEFKLALNRGIYKVDISFISY